MPGLREEGTGGIVSAGTSLMGRRSRWERYTAAASEGAGSNPDGGAYPGRKDPADGNGAESGGPGVSGSRRGPSSSSPGGGANSYSGGSPGGHMDGISAILRRLANSLLGSRTSDQTSGRSGSESVGGDLRPHTELRLVPVAACAWASAAAAVRLPGPVSLLAAATGAVFLLLLLLLSRRRRKPRFLGRTAAVLAPLAVLVLVASSAGSAVVSRAAGPAGAAVASGASITGQFTAISDARAAAADRLAAAKSDIAAALGLDA